MRKFSYLSQKHRANIMINNLLDEGKEERIKMIVIDEIHMLTDQNRGFLLEIILSKIKFLLHDKIQIIGMSATLPNISDLSGWLGASLYNTTFRPTNLTIKICMDKKLYNIIPTIFSPKSTTSHSTSVYNEVPMDVGFETNLIESFLDDKKSDKTDGGNRNIAACGNTRSYVNTSGCITANGVGCCGNGNANLFNSDPIYDYNSSSSNNNDNDDNSYHNDNNDNNDNNNDTGIDRAPNKFFSITQSLPPTIAPSQPLRRSQRYRPSCLTTRSTTNNIDYNHSLLVDIPMDVIEENSILNSMKVKGDIITQSLNEIDISHSDSHLTRINNLKNKEIEFDPNIFEFEYEKDVLSFTNELSINNLEHINTSHNTKQNIKDSEGLLSLCLETMLEGKSVMLFCPSKRRCEICSTEIANILKTIPSRNDNNYDKIKSLSKIGNDFQNNRVKKNSGVIDDNNKSSSNHSNNSNNGSNNYDNNDNRNYNNNSSNNNNNNKYNNNNDNNNKNNNVEDTYFSNNNNSTFVNTSLHNSDSSSKSAKTSTSPFPFPSPSPPASSNISEKTTERKKILDELRLAPVRLCEVSNSPSYLASLTSFRPSSLFS